MNITLKRVVLLSYQRIQDTVARFMLHRGRIQLNVHKSSEMAKLTYLIRDETYSFIKEWNPFMIFYCKK